LRADEPDLELVVVERAPSGLQRLAADENVNYLDLQGRGRVVAPGFVYVAEPLPTASSPLAPSKTSPFAPNASRVVRTLLSDPAKHWRLSGVAQLTELNPGNVHRALRALVEHGTVERGEDGYVVVDAGTLLEAWADQARAPRDRLRLHVREGDDLRTATRRLLEDLGSNAAVVSGELAAEELAPYLPAERAIVHTFDPERFARVEGVRDGVGQIEVDLVDAGYGQFSTIQDGLPLASPQQVYVDLARDFGRGRQAADHVRNVVLGF
jgi:hypothetical protein